MDNTLTGWRRSNTEQQSGNLNLTWTEEIFHSGYTFLKGSTSNDIVKL